MLGDSLQFSYFTQSCVYTEMNPTLQVIAFICRSAKMGKCVHVFVCVCVHVCVCVCVHVCGTCVYVCGINFVHEK